MNFTLKDKPPLLRIGIILLPFILISSGAYLFLFAPKIKEIGRVTDELAAIEKKILDARILKSECDLPTDEEKRFWEETKLELWSKIPPQENLLSLMEDLAKIAKEVGIRDISFDLEKKGGASRLERQPPVPSPMEAEAAPPGQITSLELKLDSFFLKTSFHCHYQYLASFSEGVERLPRLLEIESLQIKRELPMMAVELVLKAYYLKREKNA